MTGTSADPEPLAGIDLGFLSILSCTGRRLSGTQDGRRCSQGLITPRGSYSEPGIATTPPRHGVRTVGFPNGMPSPMQSARPLAKAASSGSLEGAKQALADSRVELDSHKKKREFLELQRKVRSCAGRKCDQIAAASVLTLTCAARGRASSTSWPGRSRRPSNRDKS